VAVLQERKVWRKDRPANRPKRSTDLTPEEQENVRRALAFLSKRLGDTAKLARAMGTDRSTAQRSMRGDGVSAGIAIRIARLAAVSVESVLGGSWPPEGACPHCGRG
jgi:uncharacterized membrane protein